MGRDDKEIAGMKIAWFTPFTKTSAIGKVSAQVCEKMICQHDVEIWTQHSSDLISTTVPVVHFDANIHADALKDYDAIVYNLGNFAGFHREIRKGNRTRHHRQQGGFRYDDSG